MRWRGGITAVLVPLALLGVGCGGGGEVRAGSGDVIAVVDVDEALEDGGGFRYRYTSSYEGYDMAGFGTTEALTIEGRRDVSRQESVELRTSTYEAPAPEGSVDEHLTELVVEAESATTGGSLWARSVVEGGEEQPWAEVGPVDWSRSDDILGDEVASLLDAAASVERYEVRGTDAVEGDALTRLGGRGEDPYGEPVDVDVWMAGDGTIRRVTSDRDERLDMWDHGVEVQVELAATTDELPQGPVAYGGGGLYPEVVGRWQSEAEGTLDGQAWEVHRAAGRYGSVDVPCRLLLTEAAGDGWDDVQVAVDDDGPVCGRGGFEGLPEVVADPALQILPASGTWDADADDVLPVGVVVSSRFASGPAVLLGPDGARIEVALDADGIGVAALPGTFAIEEVELAGGTVRCTTGVDADWLEDDLHAGWLLAGVGPLCVPA